MCRFEQEPLAGYPGYRLSVIRGGERLSWSSVLAAWQTDRDLCRDFSRHLAAAPYSAFRWECPRLVEAALGAPFECVLIDSPYLDILPDPRPFQARFDAADPEERVLSFENLGGDALLVVPTPQADEGHYGHFASFLRGAPDERQHALWRATAEAVNERVRRAPVWLSTAGGGVAWLHVRLDTRPKYYAYQPYVS